MTYEIVKLHIRAYSILTLLGVLLDHISQRHQEVIKVLQKVIKVLQCIQVGQMDRL